MSTRNEQLAAQAARNREIAARYAAEGNATEAAFWEGQAQALEAERLNVTGSYLCRVLNGGLQSERLIRAIMSLRDNPSPKKRPIYSQAA